MDKVIIDEDIAIGHTDAQGNSVIGTLTTGSRSRFKTDGKEVAVNGDIVHFPSHPHDPEPADYREHFVPVTGTAKILVDGEKGALDGDRVPVADVAGPDAFMQKSQDKTESNQL